MGSIGECGWGKDGGLVGVDEMIKIIDFACRSYHLFVSDYNISVSDF